MLKTLSYLLFFYLLVLLQVSFFSHFPIYGMTLNLVLIAVVIVNILSNPGGYAGLIAAFIGGFYLDVFSINSYGFFGLYTAISLATALFIRLILKRHVRIPLAKRP